MAMTSDYDMDIDMELVCCDKCGWSGPPANADYKFDGKGMRKCCPKCGHIKLERV